jgi:tRNA G26 N,N-dimethylase Trm1
MWDMPRTEATFLMLSLSQKYSSATLRTLASSCVKRVLWRFDTVSSVYFSCPAVADDGTVLVMFSGVGPFAICVAKRQATASCIAIEFNPDGYRYCIENIRLNKVVDRVTPILGDAERSCDRSWCSYVKQCILISTNNRQFSAF